MNLITSVTGVWSEVSEWLVTHISSLQAIFYSAETGLTFIGILAVTSVGIAIFLLVMNIIRSFLRLA